MITQTNLKGNKQKHKVACTFWNEFCRMKSTRKGDIGYEGSRLKLIKFEASVFYQKLTRMNT